MSVVIGPRFTQIVPPTPSDPDAITFLTAAGITDTTISNAINTLVINLKTDGIWSKMYVIYPFVGGTASTHKWNLKDPQDTNAAFRLTFNGGWTHSSTGALPNGSTGWANTYFTTSNTTSTGIQSLGCYLRNPSSVFSSTKYSIGSLGQYSIGVFALSNTNTTLRSGNITDSVVGTTGFCGQSRISTTSWFGINNSTITTLSSSSSTLGSSAINFYLSALPSPLPPNPPAPASYGDQELAFAFIGEPLTTGEMTDFYTSVQTFQTTLGRQI